MATYLVLGVGRQGLAAAWDLQQHGGDLIIADQHEGPLQHALQKLGLPSEHGHLIDFTDEDTVRVLMDKADGALFAADYTLNVGLTKLAIETKTHAVDFGGNHNVVFEQHVLNDQARNAAIGIIPDAGLTPGMAGILVAGGMKALDSTHTAKIRVGGLPQEPKPPLNYGLLFSVRGLTNEYLEPSVVLSQGRRETRQPLGGLETVQFRGNVFEAFYTSGGVSTLPETFAGELQTLDCKTLRYPGHVELMRFALDIGLMGDEPVDVSSGNIRPREVFEKLLSDALPHDPPDTTWLRVTVEGKQGDTPMDAVYEMVDHCDEETGFTSMQRTTAFPASIILQMLVDGELPEDGVLYQERVVDTARLMKRLAERGVIIDFDLTPSV
jgi:lysine 6-dehydrogenase